MRYSARVSRPNAHHDETAIALVPILAAALTGTIGALIGLACGLAGGAANAYLHHGLHRVHALLLLRSTMPAAVLGSALGAASGLVAAIWLALAPVRMRWPLRALCVLGAIAGYWHYRWSLAGAMLPWGVPLAPHVTPLLRVADLLTVVAITATVAAAVARRSRPLRRVVAALAAGVLATLGVLALTARHLDRHPRGPSVLLVVVDALRADHLGCYGYARDTSPFLDSLASRGALFENAYSAANMTRMSVPSILGGIHPTTHGARRRSDSANPWFVSVAELLQDGGWATAFLGPNPSLDPVFGLFYGFDTYFSDDFFRTRYWRDVQRGSYKQAASAEHLNSTLLAWLSRVDSGRPFFAYLHYRDVHGPYTPPAPYDTMFAEPGRLIRPLPPDAFDRPDHYLRLADDRGDLNTYLDRYDGGIRYADDQLRALVQALATRGRLHDTVIVVTADHGEGFWEHGRCNHGSTLHEEQVHVPLIVVRPGPAQTSSRVPALACHADLMPTILELLAMPVPERVQGRSLAACLGDPTCELGRSAVFFETVARRGLRSGPWKLILDSSSGEQMLYHLGLDPRERINLLAEGVVGSPEPPQQVAQRLALLLRDHVTRTTAASRNAGAINLSKELDEQLRSLGYLQ